MDSIGDQLCCCLEIYKLMTPSVVEKGLYQNSSLLINVEMCVDLALGDGISLIVLWFTIRDDYFN